MEAIERSFRDFESASIKLREKVEKLGYQPSLKEIAFREKYGSLMGQAVLRQQGSFHEQEELTYEAKMLLWVSDHINEFKNILKSV